MERTGIYLEMTDPSQLRPAPEVPDLDISEVTESAAPTICELYVDIWAPLGGGGRGQWTPEQWADELSPANIRAWLARLNGQPVGFAELGWQANGHVGIVVIGVVPRVQGRGIGGDFLTRSTRLAWDTPAADGTQTSRVWLWTVPEEHAHTVPNYLARGFLRTDRGNEDNQ